MYDDVSECVPDAGSAQTRLARASVDICMHTHIRMRGDIRTETHTLVRTHIHRQGHHTWGFRVGLTRVHMQGHTCWGVSGWEFRVSWLGFWVWGVGPGVWGLGFRFRV